MKKVYIGNAKQDSQSSRGWFIGNFFKGLQYSKDVEIKWDSPEKEDFVRNQWSINNIATTASIVAQGEMTIIFKDKEVVLKEGDYYLSPPKIPHKSIIKKGSVVVTVRWPSIPNDHQNIPE